jgi:uncharacterized protein
VSGSIAVPVAPATCRRCHVSRHRQVPGATLALLVALFFSAFARAAETIPPKPANHFNDYAGVVSRSAATQLNNELAQFERDTSNQLVVAIFPKMQSSSSVEDYTVRVAQAWAVGQADKKNGAVLFIFHQDRKLYIQVGYGLEGAIPDATAKRIIENEITPRFRAGNFTAGVTNGVHALMAAAKGEYRGTGRTAREGRANPKVSGNEALGIFFLIVVGPLVLIILVASRIKRAIFGASRPRGRRRSILYDGRGHTVWTSLGGTGGSGSSGWSGGGGGSFSGGGGSFGGGGAGGSW